MDYVIPMLVVSPELNSCWKFLLEIPVVMCSYTIRFWDFCYNSESSMCLYTII
jgi:hypothetical protein